MRRFKQTIRRDVRPLKSTKDPIVEAKKTESLEALRLKAKEGYDALDHCREAIKAATEKAHIVGDAAFAVGIYSNNVRRVTR
jgi:hypothetical protein